MKVNHTVERKTSQKIPNLSLCVIQTILLIFGKSAFHFPKPGEALTGVFNPEL